MKKLLSSIVATGLLCSALVGCWGNKANQTPTPTPTPNQTQKQGEVNDHVKKDVITGVFNKTYVIGKEGSNVYGELAIGNPTLMHKKDQGGKSYIEVMIPLKLTNKAKNEVQPMDLLNGLTIDSNYNPYQDQLKLRCMETGAIVKGNTDKDNKEYYLGIFDKDLKKVDNKPMLASGQSVESYFKYIVTTDDIEMDKLKNANFDSLTLNDFEFIINAKDGNGYTIVK